MQPTADRVHMNGEGLTDRALSAMTKRASFQGRIVPPLTLIECLKKLLFEFKMFNVHTIIEKDRPVQMNL
jgi:hypothetical protein